MDNPPRSAGICAHCQTPATKRCSGCRGAAEHSTGGSTRSNASSYRRANPFQGLPPCFKHYCIESASTLIYSNLQLPILTALDEKIPALANVYGGKLKLILQGSDAAFQKAKNELLDQLSICVNRCLDEIYAPERVAKRSRMARKTSIPDA
ncbi:hypothetical protein BDV41DRAFT_574570 [Aspergillus transmontanensis]|uniref:Uncharacterized protein n=1 Tax=Aspergillus transmontanensis TaxID=1034304 RepID=A0A5N6W4V7_9EURO|nr:hypothetical protein BDV41DRAFT_574570 [Aspergillus transmontanensis]